MESKARNQLSLFQFKLNFPEEFQKNSIEKLWQEHEFQGPRVQEYLVKWPSFYFYTNNPETEKNFRRICILSRENSTPELNRGYQEYIKTYHHITSLYLIKQLKNRTQLIIYNTEREGEEVRRVNTQETLNDGTCIARLPNGELFCYGNSCYPFSGIVLIIDSSYKARSLPSGTACGWSSAIYFNRNVYCFGGYRGGGGMLNISCRFDLDSNRWIQLAPMPQADRSCYSLIFNGGILISRYSNRDLLLYSIDLESFSTIPYYFSANKSKILINIERLYLIECGEGGFIYESKVRDEYDWELVARSNIKNSYSQFYCVYNKGAIYISTHLEKRYYKFDLENLNMESFK